MQVTPLRMAVHAQLLHKEVNVLWSVEADYRNWQTNWHRILFATEKEVPLSKAGTGVFDSLLALFIGEDVDTPSGGAALPKLLALLEDMPKPVIAKQQC